MASSETETPMEALQRDHAAMVGRVRSKLVEVILCGENIEARDQHEATAYLHNFPAAGDSLSIWTGSEEAFIDVERIVWPTVGVREHLDTDAPKVLLVRAGGYTDDEWADVFAAVKEGRQP